MIPQDFDNRCKVIEYMIKGLESEELTDWESEFVESISLQFRDNKLKNKTLSDRQCDILEKIFNKYS